MGSDRITLLPVCLPVYMKIDSGEDSKVSTSIEQIKCDLWVYNG